MHHPNFSPVAFTIPFIDLDVYWYAILFSFGMLCGLQIYTKLLQEDGLDHEQAEKHSSITLVVMSTSCVLFARLFEGVFYSPEIMISLKGFFNFRSGGLASHGGMFGVLVGLYLIRPPSGFSRLKVLDRMALCTLPLLSLIRIGNFVNQEILGRPSDLPWAVVYPNTGEALHPVTLYESFIYLALFAVFWRLRSFFQNQSKNRINEGVFGFALLSIVLVARFFCEQFKMELSEWMLLFAKDLPITMGQILSILFFIPMMLALLIALSAKQKDEHDLSS